MNGPPKKVSWLLIYAVFYLVFLYGPALLILLFSFNDSIYIVFPLSGFTLGWYEDLVKNSEMLRALKNSVVVAGFVSLVATILGLFGGRALTRYIFPGRKVIATAVAVPLAIPSLILGIGLLVIARRILGVELSLVTVAAGHLLICLPISLFALISTMENFDRTLEEASLDLGENAWMTFWRVTFPLSLPGVVASILLCFTVSFDEFVLAFFLTGNEATLPVYVYSQLRFPDKLPSVLALASCVLALSFSVVTVAEFVRQRGTTSLGG